MRLLGCYSVNPCGNQLLSFLASLTYQEYVFAATGPMAQRSGNEDEEEGEGARFQSW